MRPEQKFRRQYLELFSLFREHFPNVEPPHASWFALWMDKYPHWDIVSAFQDVENRLSVTKADVSTESVGKAVSSRLRDAALRKAVSRG